MEINFYVDRGVIPSASVYELTLDREDFRRFQGLNRDALVSPIFPNGERFWLFHGIGESDRAFKPMPQDIGSDDYFCSISAPIPKLPPHATDKQFKKFAAKADKNLENAINSSKRIPIERNSINVGYVVLRVEEQK